ncbi:MAG: aminotransferase class I/II-fold pyridoxal phosphate-dependent enzyme [Veillonellaceae bacterium]|nr:aminotransferase class I/II-fold pyridoxal phosphate-dependent enzyme [Veillonellaceae bacterium]
MATSMVVDFEKGQKALDSVFKTSNEAKAEIAKYGKDTVIDGTIGTMMDEEGQIIFLPTVKKEFLSLSSTDYVSYAPIIGNKAYHKAVIAECFGDHKPATPMRVVSTVGGTGAIHHLMHNYAEQGTEVLISDWHWGAYDQICAEQKVKPRTFSMLTEDCTFDFDSFKKEVTYLADHQERVVILLNTPGNNPTGYTITTEEWQQIIDFLKAIADNGENKVILSVDVAYIDYAGDGDKVREFFALFENLPRHLLVTINYTLSKGFTMYGLRAGALIALSSDQDVLDEFTTIGTLASRGTWSNVCHPAMQTVVNIMNDLAKFKVYEEERKASYQMIEERAHIFESEAKACGLHILPYCGGFFITIPCQNAKAIVADLKAKHIFVIAMANGIRVAVCSMPKRHVKGLAAKIKDAMDVRA